MNNKIRSVLLIISLILYGCSGTQITQNPTIAHEVDIDTPLPPKWTPTNIPQFTSTSTKTPASAKTLTRTPLLTRTITSTSTRSSTATNFPLFLQWVTRNGIVTYETAEWIEDTQYSISHRDMLGCRIETIEGRCLPPSWSRSDDTQTIGNITFNRTRWTQDGVLKLTRLQIPYGFELGFSIPVGNAIESCMRAASKVILTFQAIE